jgi:anti-sigma-K factor RskA
MTDQGDRMARAGNYVLGLMDDGERERAERDLEIDPSFRDAVVLIAERMHVFDHIAAPGKVPDGVWKQIKQRIAEMPQMRAMATPEPPATFGRRRSDARRDTIMPAAPKVRRIGLHSIPGWRAALLAASLIAAFALGYVAGVSSFAKPPPTAVTEP